MSHEPTMSAETLRPTAHEITHESDSVYASLVRPLCSCGWGLSGFVREDTARYFAEAHKAGR